MENENKQEKLNNEEDKILHKFCKSCEKEIDNGAIVCPHCGGKDCFSYEKEPIKACAQHLLEVWTIMKQEEEKEIERILKIEDPFIIKNGKLIKYEGLEQDVVIPDGVKVIGKRAFENTALNYKRLTSITIPNSVEVIEEFAFKSCYNLEKIDIPDTVKSVGENAFRSCTKLSEVNLPKYLEKIEEGCFSHCESLEYIKFPNMLQEIGDSAFYSCYKLKNIDIPDSVKIIGFASFFNTNQKIILAPSGCECKSDRWTNYNKKETWTSQIKFKK